MKVFCFILRINFKLHQLNIVKDAEELTTLRLHPFLVAE